MASSSVERDDAAAGEVAAMQFAGGLSIAQVAETWERDAAWVEAAVRRALLEQIPLRDGGLKVSRAEEREERFLREREAREAQSSLDLKP